jgi:hypothetical protein
MAAAMAAGAVVVVVACARTPEPSPSASSSSSASSSPQAASAPASASAARPTRDLTDVETLCAGAYMGDAPILEQRCSKKDYQTAIALERAAAHLCVNDMNTLIGGGRAKLDSTKTDACIDAVRDAASKAAPGTQGTGVFTIAPCDVAVTGTVAEGAACRFPPECAAGLTCVGYQVGIEGACKKPAKVGGDCSPQRYGGVFDERALALHHVPCASGAYCDGHKCVLRAKDGAACTSSDVCADGHACVMGKCAAAPSAQGGACASNKDCGQGLFCDGATCAAQKAAGEACKADQCKGVCDVPAGKTDGTCVASCGSG